MELERKQSRDGMYGIEQKNPEIGCMQSELKSS
jgi:hypothetical protein